MSVTTPKMGLIQPTINVDSGLSWEQAVNTNSTTIDQHNHSLGSGAQIDASGISLTKSLPFNNNSATSLQSVVFQPQTSLSTLLAVYTVGNDLYFNDGASNVIRITSGGTVNATSSGISSGTATASFVASVLVVNSASNTPANIQVGSVLLGNTTSGSKFLTLSPPNAMGSNYSLTLPTIPASQSFLTLDGSGNFGAPYSINQGLLRSNLPPVGQQISGSSGAFFTTSTSYVPVTNLSVTITTSGRPIMVFCTGDGTDGGTNFGNCLFATSKFGYAILKRGTGIIMQQVIPAGASIAGTALFLLDPQSAGTYTYSVWVATNTSGGALWANQVALVAYEL